MKIAFLKCHGSNSRDKYSHCEMIFEEGDCVTWLMPDGSCQPDDDGALWCASSVKDEKLPALSPKRAGKTGGVRFRRRVIDSANWDIVDIDVGQRAEVAQLAAIWFVKNQGMPHPSFFSKRGETVTASQAVAGALKIAENKRIDCTLLHCLVERFFKK